MSLLRNLKRVVISAALLAATVSRADPIDPYFGSNYGYAFDTLFWYSKDLSAQTAILDSYDNIYVVGKFNNVTDDTFVYSQNSDGLDRSYGQTPVATNSSFASFENSATSASVDESGRVLVGGYITFPLSRCPDGSPTTSYAFVTRFNLDGTLDTSFGVSGTYAGSAFMALPCASPYSTKIVVQPSGKIVLAATAWPNDGSSAYILVSRLAADGSSDSTFGNGGETTLAVAADEDLFLSDLLTTNENELVLAGMRRSRATYKSSTDIFEFDANGGLDSSFGSSGIYRDPNTSLSSAIAVDSSGRLYLACASSDDDSMSVTRFTAKGVSDSTFGLTGRVKHRVAEYQSLPTKLLLDSRGRLNVFGFSRNWQHDTGAVFLLHLNADGSANKAVGSYGIYSQPCGLSSCSLRGALIDQENRPIIATYTDSQTILFRYDELFGAGFD